MRRTSKYVVFPQRQPYFTYGDLHFSGLANLAFQVFILQCKILRYSDFLKMCLKPMEFEYFCITWLQHWQNDVSCDHQNLCYFESKWRSSKYVVFLQRQLYVTNGERPLKWPQCIWRYAHRCLVNTLYWFSPLSGVRCVRSREGRGSKIKVFWEA